MAPMPREVITTAEAAAMLGTSTRYVTDRVKKGEIRGYVYGNGRRRIYRIVRQSAIDFMMRHDASGGLCELGQSEILRAESNAGQSNPAPFVRSPGEVWDKNRESAE